MITLSQQIKEHENIIHSALQRFYPHIRGDVYDLFMQIGRIGLWKALIKHDSRRSRLSTFATKMIRWEIQHEMRSHAKQGRYRRGNPGPGYYCTNTQWWEMVPDNLNETERKVVELLTGGYNLTETSNLLGCSPNKVKQICKKCLQSWE